MDGLLEDILNVLGTLRSDGAFVSRRTLPASSLKLRVKAVGQIRLPVTAHTARSLCGIARPARHGYKQETRLDRRVRDTWEIMQEQILVDEPRWLQALEPALDGIRADLGLSEGCHLTAGLHNLLVYAPGQFFRPHQDSEKGDGMIATLVVVLPSRFSGGDLLIEHQGRTTVIGGSQKDLTLVAFYADCHHQVRPVLRGFRVVLTYNLFLTGEPRVTPPADQLDQLTEAVKEHFSGDRDQLVRLLDHQYTDHGLAWNRLKGSDTVTAAVLREVARRLDLHILLARAEVHETWDCEDYPDMGDDAWPGPPPATIPARLSLDESQRWLRLRRLIGPQTPAGDVSASVDPDDVCWTTDSRDLSPFKTEYEPYMGNWGNTVEYWYRRAAIALWPRDRIFIIQARASPLWALHEISRRLASSAGHAEALHLARQLPSFWPTEMPDDDEAARLLAAAAPVAAQLGDTSVAYTLLVPHALGHVGAESAPYIAALLDRHGLAWCQGVVREWIRRSNIRRAGTDHGCWEWPGTVLTPLSRALCRCDHGEVVVSEILNACWALTREDLKTVRDQTAAAALKDRLQTFAPPLLGLLQTAALLRDNATQERVLRALTADADDLIPLQLAMLRQVIGRHSGETPRNLGLAAVHAQASRALTRQLAELELTRNDWSITTRLRCGCPHCKELARFLISSRKVLLERPASAAVRHHLLAMIVKEDLPVRSPIWEQSPYNVLVLAKTRDLFDRAEAGRQSAERELEWLRETAVQF